MQLPLVPMPRYIKLERNFLIFKHSFVVADVEGCCKMRGWDQLLEFFALKQLPACAVFVISSDMAGLQHVKMNAPRSVARVVRDKGAEAYDLKIMPAGIVLTAGGSRGALWAVRTLQQLAQKEGLQWRIPCGYIQDWPSFPSRGVMLDCNAHSDTVANPMRLDYLRSVIDRISYYKLNTFYLYSDWNFVKLNTAPELAPPGALSKLQIRELIKYAASRGVEIIPEFNSFGHWSQAMRKYHRELSEAGSGANFDPSNPAVYKFLDKIIGETAELFPSQWFHAGCDEVAILGKCPRCKKIGADKSWVQHINRLNALVKKHGKRLIVYADYIFNECICRPEKLNLLDLLDPDIVLEYWKYVDCAHPCFRAMVRHDTDRYYQALSAGYTLERIMPAYAIRLDNIEGLASRIQRDSLLRKACRRVNISIWQQFGRWMELAWPGICRHADVAWYGSAGVRRDFYRRFTKTFLGVAAPALMEAAEKLGNCHIFDKAGGDRITMTDLFVDLEQAVFNRFTREELLRRIAKLPSCVARVRKSLEKWRGKITTNHFFFENLVLAIERTEFLAQRLLLMEQARAHYRKAVIRRHFSAWGERLLPPDPKEVLRQLNLCRECLRKIRRLVPPLKKHIQRVWEAAHAVGEVFEYYHGRRFDDYRRDLDGLIGELSAIIDNYEPDMYPSQVPQADRVFILQGQRKYKVKTYQ